MGRHALLGASVIVFCVTGLIVGIVRLVPGRDATALAFAVVAALLGRGSRSPPTSAGAAARSGRSG